MKYDFELLKSQFNLRDEARRVLGNPVQHTNKNDTYSCPFHAEKTVGGFRVYDDHYYCYSCEAYGDVLDFLVWANGETLSDISRRANMEIDDADILQRKKEIVEKKRLAAEIAAKEYQNALDNLRRMKKWLKYHDQLDGDGRIEWNRRGIPNVWQDIWELGYSPDFYAGTSITMPIKDIDGNVKTIRHRVLNPKDGRKYLPETSGLGSHPFICNTDLQRGEGDLLIIAEGEIKSAVTYITLDRRGAQCIGVPSKSMMDKYVRLSRGRNAIVIPDPDGADEILDAAKFAGTRVLRVGQKIDDMILQNNVTKAELNQIIRQARVL